MNHSNTAFHIPANNTDEMVGSKEKGSNLWIQVKKAMVFKPQEKNLILLYILFHQRP